MMMMMMMKDSGKDSGTAINQTNSCTLLTFLLFPHSANDIKTLPIYYPL